MSAKSIAKPFMVLAALLFLAACGSTARVADSGRSAAQGSADPAAELIVLINAERGKAGLPALAVEPGLSSAASAHARAMGEQDCYDRDCGGLDVNVRVARTGYRYALVRTKFNAGYPSPQDIFAEMTGSDIGRKLMLRADFRHIGAGYHFQARDVGKRNYFHYWTVSYGVPANENLDEIAREMTRLVNLEREARGSAPVALNPLLTKSAQFHARYMADNDCFDHRCPDEPDLVVRAGNAGYEFRMISENIASAMIDPAEAVRSWMTSEGHRGNMLDPDMREIGVGFVLLNEDGGKQRSRQYWVQNFGTPK
jgi:uncharacterized protein YkwD